MFLGGKFMINMHHDRGITDHRHPAQSDGNRG